MFGTIYNTTVNVNGRCVGFSSYNSLSPMCGFGYGGWSPGCFGFGFSQPCYNPFMFGAGVGAGMAVGTMLPGIFKGIGQACGWAWNNAIVPAFKGVGKGCSWLWNKAIVPGAKGIGQGCSWVWNKAIVPAAKGVAKGVSSAAKWIGNGCKNLWNKIFHKS